MMNKYWNIVKNFDLSELEIGENMKSVIRHAVEFILETESSYPEALKLSAIMTKSFRNPIRVSESFAAVHPENRVDVYSTPDVFLAFYCLFLASKARNLYNAQEEVKSGVCSAYTTSCACDQETCSMCKDKFMETKLSACDYSTIPPFHVGCRCGMFFVKDAEKLHV